MKFLHYFSCIKKKIKDPNKNNVIEYLNIKVKEKGVTKLIVKMYIEIYVHNCQQYSEDIFILLPSNLLKIYAKKFKKEIKWDFVFKNKNLNKNFIEIFEYEYFIYIIQNIKTLINKK